MHIPEYLRKLLSNDKTVSLARHGALLSVLVFLSLDVYAVLTAAHGGIIPALPTKDQLIGQAAIFGSLYGTGKFGETLQGYANKGDGGDNHDHDGGK